MLTHLSQVAQTQQNEATVKVVIYTDNAVGKPDRLVLHDVPFPVSFDYLAAQMRTNEFPEPREFSARTRVSLKVVEEPSSFDPNTLSGYINADEPLCQYYYNHLRDIVNVSQYNTQANAEGDAASPGLSCAKIGECGDTVKVGGVSIAFMRTLRVPDDGKTYVLPARLDKFPLYNAADFASQLPQSIARKGGLLMAMHQCEAMWISFAETEVHSPYAVKVSTGGVNAITGMPKNITNKGRQDYLTVGPGDNTQAWLDGFSTERGVVRQFVAIPTGHKLSIEAQITGKENVGGIQIDVFPLYNAPPFFYYGPGQIPLYKNYSAHRANLRTGESIVFIDENYSRPLIQGSTYGLSKAGLTIYLCAVGGVYNVEMQIIIKAWHRTICLQVHLFDSISSVKYKIQHKLSMHTDLLQLQFGGRRLEDDKTLAECRITNESTLHVMLPLRGGGEGPDASDRAGGAGFAAGGKISQKIIRDRFSAAAYNFGAGCRLHVTILSPAFLSQLTGRAPIPTPISMKTYLKAGLPWFALYDKGTPSANNISFNHPLASIKSLLAGFRKRRDRDANPLQYGCCYCAAATAFQLQPCGHLLCQDCADGLPEDECPKRCRAVIVSQPVASGSEPRTRRDTLESVTDHLRSIALGESEAPPEGPPNPVEEAVEDSEPPSRRSPTPPSSPSDPGAMAENQDSAALLNGSAMKPDAFDGTKSKYIAWKTQMKLYVVTQRKRLPEQFDRVLMILSYMKGGHAGEYVATFMKKYDADEDSVIQTTKTLWEDLDRHFLIDEQAEAYDRLQAMQMGALSTQEFFSKFELCAFQANIHDFEAHFQELKSLLEKALRADIIRLLYNSSEELPATYALYKQRVARIDLNQQQYRRRNPQSQRQGQFQPRQQQTQGAPRAQTSVAAPTANAPVQTRRDGTGVTFGGRGQPMDLDQARRQGLCFRCGQQGHISRNCPNRQQAQQVRATETPAVPTTNTFTPLASLNEAPAATAEPFDWKKAIHEEIRAAMKGFASGQQGA
ncbi:uncharacterized protein PHACADRAFT_205102 [Phanerochaete carnosa HHB-10118-sp]|uniref:CCHC-type domain-containing protein n=1 Tax=Phanerochaete carnosa (strain HHB-10118-sp) TaxID=650164 RepID=K5W4S3_PHACS|nr:uncharacterized protein PHACADRAFT_205102 [Phanerochaete carnosa HHB-10118-sp]EKM58883.1 hypothetical protein PHACADRAFT_205102 [Phanerochaete carnosa HHB-10118-sp]